MLDFKLKKGQPTARFLAQVRRIPGVTTLPAEMDVRLAAATGAVANAEAVMPAILELQEAAKGIGLEAASMTKVIGDVITELEGAPEKETPAEMKLRVQRFGSDAILSAAAKIDAATPYGLNVVSETENPLAAQIEDGLYARLNSKHTPTHGRAFASMTMASMAAECLGQNHRSMIGRNPGQIVMDALHSTSDFPTALGNVLNRTLIDHYEAATSGLKLVSKERTGFQDFRDHPQVRVGSDTTLDKVGEGGEFKHGKLEEMSGSFKLDTFGKILSISRQALVNDDLGAFEKISQIMGEGSAQTEAKLFVSLLSTNSGMGIDMEDGKSLFHADHGNLASAGAALSVESLSAARLAMRRQKGFGGQVISVVPAFLVVPPELETKAETVLMEIQAASMDDVNPFAGRLKLVVDPFLTNPTAWYVTSEPGRPEGLQHAYLDGASGPQFVTKEGFEVDGMQFKVRLDFGAGFNDHRGWFMNPGA